jgi:hypothetical protein
VADFDGPFAHMLSTVGRLNIRPAGSSDTETLVGLAERLCEGVAPWRDPEEVLIAVRG